MKVRMIDVPSGWKYGFPRPIPENIKDEDIKNWLLKNGYPRHEIENLGKAFYWRTWYQEQDKLPQGNIMKAIALTPDEILAIIFTRIPELKAAARLELKKRRDKRLSETFSNSPI